MAGAPFPPAGAHRAPAGCALDVAPPLDGATRYYVGRRGDGVWVVDRAGARSVVEHAAWRGERGRRHVLAAALLEDAAAAPADPARVAQVADGRLLDLPAHAFVLTDADLA